MSEGFSILERLIHLTNARHGVIASNIANADTPQYKAMDLKFSQSLNEATIELKTTSPGHIVSTKSALSEEVSAEVSQPWADGNSVELDMEVSKMTENALLFQAGMNMLSAKIRMFKNALRR